jgi:hypothetical protein
MNTQTIYQEYLAKTIMQHELTQGPPPNVMDVNWRRADALGVHTRFHDTKPDTLNTREGEDCVILPNPVKLTREKIKEGCLRIGLKAGRSNINDVNSIRTHEGPWTDPWLRLDKANGKLWLSSFGIQEKNKSKAKERAHMKKVKELCSDWDTIDGLRSCDDWFPSRNIDITFCHPDEFIRIIRQFM